MSSHDLETQISVPPEQRLRGNSHGSMCLQNAAVGSSGSQATEYLGNSRGTSVWTLHICSFRAGKSKCVKLAGIFQDFVSEIPMVGKINKGTVNGCWNGLDSPKQFWFLMYTMKMFYPAEVKWSSRSLMRDSDPNEGSRTTRPASQVPIVFPTWSFIAIIYYWKLFLQAQQSLLSLGISWLTCLWLSSLVHITWNAQKKTM